MNIKYLIKGDVFRHPRFNKNLRVSDTDDGIVQTEDMNQTGEHVAFIGDQMDDEVTLISTNRSRD